jgi:hypothetical protein
MGRALEVAVISASLAISLTCAAVSGAQKATPVPTAPVPAQILSAKKVFIANGGGDESRFESPQYSGGPDRLYNEFYAAMKSWGRYELVSSPAEADLIFEVSLTLIQVTRADAALKGNDPAYDSLFRLTIRDLQTHTTLWGLTEHAQVAVLQGNRDKNFEQALFGIMFELKKITEPAQADANAAATPGK